MQDAKEEYIMTMQHITANRTIHQNLDAGVDIQPHERLDAKIEVLDKIRECAKPPISVMAKDTEYPSKLHAEDVLHAMERGILKLSDHTRDGALYLHCEINGYPFSFPSGHETDTVALYEKAVPDPMRRAYDILRGLERLRDEEDIGEYEYYADCILKDQPAVNAPV